MRFAFASLFAAILPVVGQADGSAREPIIFVIADNYAPFLTAEGGILGDIVKEAVSRLEDDFVVQYVSVPWARAVGMVEHGQAHALVGTYYKPEDRPWIAPYSEPLLQEHVAVFCREGVAQASWSYPQDFAGLVFGNNNGYRSPGTAFFQMVDSGLIELQEAPTTAHNLKKLAHGRIDCYVNERFVVEMTLQQEGITGVERVTDASVEESLIGYLGEWSDAPVAQSFIAALDAQIQSLQEDGTIDSIISTHIRGN